MDVTLVSIPHGPETLAGTLATPEGKPLGCLVLVHGFLSSRFEVAEAAERLAERGWVALAIDFTGHGGSTGPRGRTGRAWMVADARRAGAFLREQGFEAPLGIVGHSTGGPMALAVLAEAEEFKAGAVVAPLRTLRHEMTSLERGAVPLLGRVSKAATRLGLPPIQFPYRYAKAYDRLFDDQAAAARARERGFLQKTASLAWVDEGLSVDGEAWARTVAKPVLVIVATHDRVVAPENSRAVYKALAGDKRLVELPTGHSVFGDTRGAEAVAAVDRWFREKLHP
ncbi:MAG TPA: alpha/beta fold hydrolase [Candidatus Thermoplasmatota archaeon]|nr:alpha/beta fold hydrolase [Candidatus Thermoplasmatota archaeon]